MRSERTNAEIKETGGKRSDVELEKNRTEKRNKEGSCWPRRPGGKIDGNDPAIPNRRRRLCDVVCRRKKGERSSRSGESGHPEEPSANGGQSRNKRIGWGSSTSRMGWNTGRDQVS
jgi:hypothetical protein